MKKYFVVMTAAVIVSMAVLVSCGKDDDKVVPAVITITTQPINTGVTQGKITESLTVEASVTEGATLSYKWFENNNNSNAGGTAVSGATNATFAIPTTLTAAESPYYYFCEVSATGGAAKVRSNVATVTVTVAEPVQDGSAAHPFLVNSEATLKNVGSDTDGRGLDKCYLQTANITLSGTWKPIGTNIRLFTGVYDGGGYSITGLNPISTDPYRALFAVIGPGGEVRNLALKNVNINTTNDYVGGIAGLNRGLIENCYVTGTISGGGTVGGIAGSNYGGTIQNCYTTCSVKGTGGYIGGIAGSSSSGGKIYGGYATREISGLNYVGGITGSGVDVSRCVALNISVTATFASGSAGRVAGFNESGTFNFNYARGSMTLKLGTTVITSPSPATLTSIHGATILLDATMTTKAFWELGADPALWDIGDDRLPWLKTTTGAAFKETQNPVVS